MITFEQFKKDWREREANEGTKQEVVGPAGDRHIAAGPALTDAELLEMYRELQSHAATGVEHHGDIISAGGDHGHVLTLGDFGH